MRWLRWLLKPFHQICCFVFFSFLKLAFPMDIVIRRECFYLFFNYCSEKGYGNGFNWHSQRIFDPSGMFLHKRLFRALFFLLLSFSLPNSFFFQKTPWQTMAVFTQTRWPPALFVLQRTHIPSSTSKVSLIFHYLIKNLIFIFIF